MYNDIIHLLDTKRLKEALVQLTALAEGSSDWKLKNEIESLQTTYKYMIQYASQGMNDPGRSEMYHSLITQCYKLADIAEQNRKTKEYNSEYKYAYSKHETDSYSRLADMLELTDLSDIASNYKSETFSQDDINKTRIEHENAVDELFLTAWVSTQWSDYELSAIERIIRSNLIPVNDIATFIAGITLSLLNVFDYKKFIVLTHIYRDREEAILTQRTLIGILIVAYFQEKRLKLYPEAVSALELLKEVPQALHQIKDIQTLLLLTRETEKIDKKMREEIIPQMMKNSKLMNSKFKIEELEDIEDLEDLNPEWKEGMEKFGNKMKEIGELQMEGADTYMGTFSQLKHYPFFKIAAHWFYVFDKKNSTVNSIFAKRKENDKSMLSLLIDTHTFCNSDKYSFCITISSLKGAAFDYLVSQLDEQNEMIDRGRELEHKHLKDNLPLNICRQYIQDLYRFFKLWRYRNEVYDIFKDKLTLWKCDLLKPLIVTEESVKHIADHLLNKGYMDEAAEMYENIAATYTNDADIQQKLGFAYQKLGCFEKAIKAFAQADILKPDHIWTMKHLAQCYRRTEQYDKALEYQYKIVGLQPENLNMLLQTGQSLALLGNFDEALKFFYKVEYLGNTPENAQRAIGWCYFMSGKLDKALDIYQKIISHIEPNSNDWLNMGHVYFAKNEISKAIECYKKVDEKCKSHDEFLSLYLKDKKALKEQGITEDNIYLMGDMI